MHRELYAAYAKHKTQGTTAEALIGDVLSTFSTLVRRPTRTCARAQLPAPREPLRAESVRAPGKARTMVHHVALVGSTLHRPNMPTVTLCFLCTVAPH